MIYNNYNLLGYNRKETGGIVKKGENRMIKVKPKALVMWSMVFVSTLAIISSVHSDIYLVIYWSILFLFASWCVLNIHNRVVDTLRVFSIFYVVLLAFGPMILYMEGFDYYKKVGNLIIISYLCFAVGYRFLGKGKFKNPLRKMFLPANNPRVVFVIAFIVFCVAMGAYAIYFARNWRFIFTSDLESGRVTAMKGNGLFLWIGSLVWLAVYMMYEQALISGKYKKVTYLMFAGAAIFSLLLGFRSALVNPIMVMFFMKNKRREIPIQKMVVLALALFAFVGIYGAIRGGEGSSYDSLILEFKVSSVNLNYVMDTFPSETKYQMGATYLMEIQSLIYDDVVGVTMWLKNVLNLKFSGGGVTPTLIGEFYLNWGILGVLFGMTFSGALFKRIDRAYRNPNNSVFLSCLILGYIRPIIRGGFANSMINLLVYVIGYCGCQFVAKKIKA